MKRYFVIWFFVVIGLVASLSTISCSDDPMSSVEIVLYSEEPPISIAPQFPVVFSVAITTSESLELVELFADNVLVNDSIFTSTEKRNIFIVRYVPPLEKASSNLGLRILAHDKIGNTGEFFREIGVGAAGGLIHEYQMTIKEGEYLDFESLTVFSEAEALNYFERSDYSLDLYYQTYYVDICELIAAPGSQTSYVFTHLFPQEFNAITQSSAAAFANNPLTNPNVGFFSGHLRPGEVFGFATSTGTTGLVLVKEFKNGSEVLLSVKK